MGLAADSSVTTLSADHLRLARVLLAKPHTAASDKLGRVGLMMSALMIRAVKEDGGGWTPGSRNKRGPNNQEMRKVRGPRVEKEREE